MHVRRKSDKVRLVGWINLALTLVTGVFVQNHIAVIVVGGAWVVAVFAVTEIAAWWTDVTTGRIARF
jgi:hypothetical protein